ncbi:hypothetical protein HJC99_03565 [Candidatus Saccharibacteria bacterium]|nr:hypothetical protein [Candidatus Saccharibacteria bacterium]
MMTSHTTKRGLIGGSVLLALGTAAAASGWSTSHLTAELAAANPTPATGQVEGVSTSSSPSITPMLHGSSEQVKANNDQAAPATVVGVTPTPVAMPSPSAAITPPVVISPTPQPTLRPAPITTPICGACGGPIRSQTSAHIMCPMMVCRD